MRPRIGITYSNEIRVEPYAEAVRASGGDPIPIRPGETVDLISLDGLVLGGGVDVDPALYGELSAPETEAPNRERDAMELKLIAEAQDRDLPILGICRGMQILNVARGGSLKQHMEGHEVRPDDKSSPAHEVEVGPNSQLEKICEAGLLQVNSRHHQGVAQIGDSLRVSARAAEGTVEALEDPRRTFVIGVQWHPEDMALVNGTQKRLFDALVRASRDFASASARQ